MSKFIIKIGASNEPVIAPVSLHDGLHAVQGYMVISASASLIREECGQKIICGAMEVVLESNVYLMVEEDDTVGVPSDSGLTDLSLRRCPC
jgi:hypothetical protein